LADKVAQYTNLEKDLFSCIYFADRWRCKCAVRTPAWKHVQGGKFKHRSLPHLKTYSKKITISLEFSEFYQSFHFHRPNLFHRWAITC